MTTNVSRRRTKNMQLSKKGMEVNGYDKNSSDDADYINESIATDINITFMFEEHKEILPEYTGPQSESEQNSNPTQKRYDYLTRSSSQAEEHKSSLTHSNTSQNSSPRSPFRKMCKLEDISETLATDHATDFEWRYDCKKEDTSTSPQAASVSNGDNETKVENCNTDDTSSNVDISNAFKLEHHDGIENNLQESDVPSTDQRSNLEDDVKTFLTNLQTSMIFGSNNEINVANVKTEETFNRQELSTLLNMDQVTIKNSGVDSTLNSPRTPNDTYISSFDFRTPNSKHDVSAKETPLLNKRQTPRKLNRTPDNTPSKRKKRKTSSITDYELSETIKTEVCDAGDNTDAESIKLLHDLDSIINFEDIKVSADVLSSSVFANITEDCSENDAATFNDPPVDPLHITTDDESIVIKKSPSKTESKSDNMDVTDDEMLTTRRENNNEDNVTDEIPVANKRRSSVGDSTRVTRLQKAKELGKLIIPEEVRNCLGEMKSKLRFIKIQLLHEVPPQHKLESAPWRHGLTKEQQKEFVKYSNLRVGPFTAQEDEIIMKNWKVFCKIHNWHPDDARQFCHLYGNYRIQNKLVDEKKKFPQFLANGLPWRSLHRVYKRFQNLHCRPSRYRRYTSYENKKIICELKNCRRSKLYGVVYKLAKLFNRTEHSITTHYNRLKRLKRKQKENPLWPTFNWTIPAVNKFIKYLLYLTRSKNILELKHAEIPNAVWMELDKELNVGYQKLKRFWLLQLHMQLFCTKPIYSNDIKIKLIEYIYGKGISRSNGIIWSNVAIYFEGMTPEFLREKFRRLTNRVSKNENIKRFPDLIECLHDVYIPKIRDQRIDRYLPRLKYRNGSVSIVNEAVDLPK